MSWLEVLNQKSFLYHFSKYIFVVKSGLQSFTRPLSSEEIAFVLGNSKCHQNPTLSWTACKSSLQPRKCSSAAPWWPRDGIRCDFSWTGVVGTTCPRYFDHVLDNSLTPAQRFGIAGRSPKTKKVTRKIEFCLAHFEMDWALIFSQLSTW